MDEIKVITSVRCWFCCPLLYVLPLFCSARARVPSTGGPAGGLPTRENAGNMCRAAWLDILPPLHYWLSLAPNHNTRANSASFSGHDRTRHRLQAALQAGRVPFPRAGWTGQLAPGRSPGDSCIGEYGFWLPPPTNLYYLFLHALTTNEMQRRRTGLCFSMLPYALPSNLASYQNIYLIKL